MVTSKTNVDTTAAGPAHVYCNLLGLHGGNAVPGTWTENGVVVLNKAVGISEGTLTLHEAFTVPSTTELQMRCGAQNTVAHDSWMSAVKVRSLALG